MEKRKWNQCVLKGSNHPTQWKYLVLDYPFWLIFIILFSPKSQRRMQKILKQSNITVTVTFILWWKCCGRRPHFHVVQPRTAAETENLFLLHLEWRLIFWYRDADYSLGRVKICVIDKMRLQTLREPWSGTQRCSPTTQCLKKGPRCYRL